METLLLLNPQYKALSDQKQLLVSNQYLNLRKKKATIYLWLLFLGGIGAHHYYMGNIIAGILYTMFCWTFVPAILSVLELFMAGHYVDSYNEKLINNLICCNS